jgi:hypothetical protein
MRLIIDIPDTQYNNIMEVKSMSLGRIPYKGIIMNAIRGIRNGTPIPDNATVCDIEQIKGKHDEMMKYSYSYGKKDVLEQMRAEVRQLTEYGRMGDSKFILDTDVLRIIDSYTK